MIDLSALAAEVALPLHCDDPQSAATLALRGLSEGRPEMDTLDIKTEHDAFVVLNGFLQALLDNDLYVEAARLLWKPTVFTAEPKFVKRIFKALFTEKQLFVQGAASCGKCVNPNTPTMMFDGSVKKASEVKEGDLLMGDDSTPRTVLSITRGHGPMYRIQSNQGSWECNGAHQLVLECALSITNGDGKTISSGYTEGKRVEVEVEDYLKWSAQRKRYYKQYRVGVDFPEREVPIDPYIFGLWVGDGSSNAAALTKLPGAALDRWKEYFVDAGFELYENTKKNTKASTWFARGKIGRVNPATELFRNTLRNGEKALPEVFLKNSRAVRLAVLAGLIDSDGSVVSGGFTITTKFAGLKDDIVYLAQSLGLRAVARTKVCSIKSIGFSGVYWRVYMGGEVSEVPTLERKGVSASRACHREAFTVAPIGDGEYVGFSVDGNHRYLLGDFLVTHNSFSIGVWLYLDWRRDPQNTNVQIVGPSEKHLKLNIFSHLVNLHNSCTIPNNAVVTEMCIAMDPHDLYAGIKGVVIPKGKASAGRLQGAKVKNRATPHPTFGNLTRLRVFIEEAENVNVGIWEDTKNLAVNPASHYRCVAAYNPKDRASQVGIRAEPIGGWGQIDIEHAHEWDSKRGYKVLRLDAMQSENILLQTELYQGLQTQAGMESIIAESGGVNTAGYFSMVRGWYPEEGLDTTVIPAGLLKDERFRGEFIFGDEPENVAAIDSALEGEDNAIMSIGRYGMATGFKKFPDLQHPSGEIVQFQKANGVRYFKWVLQVDQTILLPKGRTEEVSDSIVKFARAAGIKPEWMGIDRTGNGAGIHDRVRSLYGDAVHGINGSTSSTMMRILVEDSKLPCDEYNLLYTELWFALKKWIEVEVLKIGPAIPSEPLLTELGGRRYLQPNSNPKKNLETKKAFKSRGNKSPDRADTLTILLHVVRLQTSVQQSYKEDGRTSNSGGEPMKQRLDVTNRFDSLD